jgi:DNA topoisomerase-2
MSSTSSSSTNELNDSELLSKKYQKKTDKQHILDAPDTYLGSVENVDSDMWIWDDSEKKIIDKNISIIPGLFKMYDEAITNARDHAERMKSAIENKIENSIPVSYIDVSISDDGIITMINDGNGIDVELHPEYNIWIPELIFGNLRTSTNYDKTEKKIVGGKNGFGFKLVLIWSTYGYIETLDHVRRKLYKQTFRNNLDIIEKPIITDISGKSNLKPYTKISFKPDYKRLGIDGLSNDMKSLFIRRIYDIAAVTDKSVKVKYNSDIIGIKNFQNYVDLYIGNKETVDRVYEEASPRWEYVIALAPSQAFTQISFVNGIHTSKGGKHVEYIISQIVRKLTDYIEKKKKVKVSPSSIKEQLILFLRCDIENPAFDSQTKDFMNTPFGKFGSTCNVSDKFIEKIAKMGVMNAACAITEVKDTKLAKRTDGIKSKSIRGIPKLIDANWAGTDKSSQCIIIFCEGDSAKAGIVSGLSSEDRNVFGVYPLKGKLLNVRGEPTKKISENKEIADIKKILGLETNKKYTSIDDVNKNLRYSKILFMTDADVDGSHIKGLCVNLFHSEWASLANIPGFIGFMNTPILKANKGQNTLMFYNDGEYNQWKESTETKSWNIKYYKGLGTSTAKEFQEYFKQKKIVGFYHEDDKCDDAIDMAFNKKRPDDRKEWLENYDREIYIDTNKEMISYKDFIDKELIHFSKYDCDRSIPNVMDGLKTSQRKILYSAFKKNLTSEIKVAQFSGYVSEKSCYHHGEASLNKAIVGMAQNYVGSNNINLLLPNGQFGTRLQGGKDSASERYIFTLLNKITRQLFPEKDDDILDYLNDDGTQVEPMYYTPIIPMVLVNGSNGIGTGFRSFVPCYNPIQIIDYLESKLKGLDATNYSDFVPYYQGFVGSTYKVSDTKFLLKGCYEIVGPDKIKITELPVGYWTDDFKEDLERLTEILDKDGKRVNPVVKDYDDMSRDTNVCFNITLHKGKLNELLEKTDVENVNVLEKVFKLYTTQTTTNMYLFDADDKLKKYEDVPSMIDDYFTTRMIFYQKRKSNMIESLTNKLIVLSNKARYISEILEGTIDLRKKKKDEVVQLLMSKKYDTIEDDTEYKYLTKMAMDSVTEENVEKINHEHEEKKMELEILKITTIQQMWLKELNDLKQEYVKSIQQIEDTPKKIEKSLKSQNQDKIKKIKKTKNDN